MAEPSGPPPEQSADIVRQSRRRDGDDPRPRRAPDSCPDARDWAVLATIDRCAVVGLDGVLVEVEVDVGQGQPEMVLVGLPDAAVRESQERVRAAIRNSGGRFWTQWRHGLDASVDRQGRRGRDFACQRLRHDCILPRPSDYSLVRSKAASAVMSRLPDSHLEVPSSSQDGHGRIDRWPRRPVMAISAAQPRVRGCQKGG